MNAAERPDQLPPWEALPLIALQSDGEYEQLRSRIADLHHLGGWPYPVIGRALGLNRWQVSDLARAVER